jgi:hypothetical protein
LVQNVIWPKVVISKVAHCASPKTFDNCFSAGPQWLARLEEAMERPARVPTLLSESLHRQINAYALAAGAAGVSVLALTLPADAKIIYTPAHRVILSGHGHGYRLDLNHDGITDFIISRSYCTTSVVGCPFKDLRMHKFSRNDSNAIEVHGTATRYGYPAVAALKGGSKIPDKDAFNSGGILAGYQFGSHYYGNWFNVKNHYIGLVFYIDGKKHYGWARMNVRTHKHPFTVTGILTGYAYETIPNKPIIAGKTKGPDVVAVQPNIAPGSLGHLASGRK